MGGIARLFERVWPIDKNKAGRFHVKPFDNGNARLRRSTVKPMLDPLTRLTLFIARWAGAAITFRLFDEWLDTIEPAIRHLLHLQP